MNSTRGCAGSIRRTGQRRSAGSHTTRSYQAARLIWEARPAAYYAYSGHEHHANTTQTARAISILYTLTGCFDALGGNLLFPVPPSAPVTGEDLPAAKNMAPTVGLADRPLGPARSGNVTTSELYRAILEGKPYPIRGLVGFGANILLSHTDRAHGRKALAALDFYAHADLFMTPTAEMADVVLPSASCFEREALRLGFEISPEAQEHIQLRQAVIPPLGHSRPDTAIIFDLAARLGLSAQFWDGDIDAAYRHQLSRAGVTLAQLRETPGGVQDQVDHAACKYCPGECGRHAARLRHAVAPGRDLFRNVPQPRLPAVAGVRGTAGRSRRPRPTWQSAFR